MTDRPQDSHVRVYLKAVTPSDRRFWTCPKCGQEMQRRLRPRDSSGRLKDHCGCRNFRPADPTPRHLRPAERDKSIKYKRLRREEIAAEQGKVIRVWRYFDEHVKEWRREARRKYLQDAANRPPRVKSKEDVRQAQNSRTERMTDGYIKKRLRKGIPTLKGVDFPKSLVELERLRLSIVRFVKRGSR